MASEAWQLEGASIGEGDEIANSAADRLLTLQADVTAISGETGDIAAIKAVTDVIPDAGAMTSIAQESTLEDVESEVEEIEQHSHNVERWWGAVAVPDETNAIEANVGRPFAATSGADAWGAAIPICGTGDNPVLTAQTEFDPHRLLVTDLDNDTTPWRIRFIWGSGTSGAAITAGQWSETMNITNAVPGNRAGGTAADIRMPIIAIGLKMWAQAWNDTAGEVLSFFWGAHGYPYPPP